MASVSKETAVAKIDRWIAEATRRKAGHERAQKRLDNRRYWIGIANLIASVIVTSAIFGSFTKGAETYDTPLRIGAGLMGIVAAVLASLQTFLAYGERVKKHGDAAAALEAFIQRTEVAFLESGVFRAQNRRNMASQSRANSARFASMSNRSGTRIFRRSDDASPMFASIILAVRLGEASFGRSALSEVMLRGRPQPHTKESGLGINLVVCRPSSGTSMVLDVREPSCKRLNLNGSGLRWPSMLGFQASS